MKPKNPRRYYGSLFMGALVVFLGSTTTQAINWSLGYEFSGAATPSGPVSVSISDNGSGGVTLNVNATQLSGAEHVKNLYLNYSGNLSAVTLGPVGSSATVALNKGLDSYKADGDGFFDIKIDFGSGGASRLAAGESISITLNNAAESSFNSLSVGGPVGKTGFPAAAHVGGIGPGGNDSGWVTVPEPSTYIAGGLLLLPLLAQLRRWKRTS